MPTTTTTQYSWTRPEGWVANEGMSLYDQIKRTSSAAQPNFHRTIAQMTPEQQMAMNNLQTALQTGQFNWGMDIAKQAAENTLSYTPNEIKMNRSETVQASLGYNVVDKYKPMLDQIWEKYSLTDLDTILGAMGTLPQAPDLVSAMSGISAPTASAAMANAARINRADIRELEGGNMAEKLPEYLKAIDPVYYEAVQQVMENDLRRAKDIEMQRTASAAAAAGAFGGGRHGVVEAETNRAYLDTLARQSAQLNLQKLDFARQMLESDLERQLKAGALNQSQDWNVAQGNASFEQQANLANAQNQTQANIASAQIAGQLAAQKAQAAAQGALAAYNAAVNMAMKRGDLALDWAKLKGQYGLMEAQGLAPLIDTQVRSDTEFALRNADMVNRANQFYDQLDVNVQNLNEGNRRGALELGVNAGQMAAYAANMGANTFNTLNKSLFDMGEEQRKINQQIWDAELARENLATMWPFMSTMLQLQALGMVPYGMESGGTTQVQQPFNWLGLAGLGVEGLGLALPFMLSDKQLKKDIRPMRGALEKVRHLRGVEWRWKGDGTPAAGLLAQDVERAEPAAVREFSGVKAIDVPKTVGLLTEAVKELDRKVSQKGGRRK